MEATGLTVVIFILLGAVAALIWGRAIRKKQLAAKAKPGNTYPAKAQFTKRGH